MLKVTGQRLSRSELEISQAPATRSLAASGTCGAPCARASLAAIASADSAAKMGDTRAGLADMPQRLPRPQWRRHGGWGWAKAGLTGNLCSLLRRPGRLRHRRERRLAGGPGQQVVDHELIHAGAGVH